MRRSIRTASGTIPSKRRTSVDIDLVYLLLEDHPSTLRGIDAALQRIAAKIRQAMPTVQVREHHAVSDKLLVKLTVRAQGGAEVKIEPNTVLRGTLHPTAELEPDPVWISWIVCTSSSTLPHLFRSCYLANNHN